MRVVVDSRPVEVKQCLFSLEARTGDYYECMIGRECIDIFGRNECNNKKCSTCNKIVTYDELMEERKQRK